MRNYPKSIEAYKDICDEILDWMQDWVHQNEFDVLSREKGPYWNTEKIIWYTPETYMINPNGDPNLAILRMMISEGIVESMAKDNLIYYRERKGKFNV